MDQSLLSYYRGLGLQHWQQRVQSVPVCTNQVSATACTNQMPAADWDILQQAVAQCTKCSLHATRTQTVFGVGNRQASLMIIGEAPGFNEDKQGEPFVGRAGQLLTAMLKAVGFTRDQVYIANILKCRPPENRDPQANEVATCTPYLNQQIALVQPKLLLAVGRIAAHYLLQTKASLESLRNKTHQYGENNTPLLITYHPAYLLRSPADKKKAFMDLQFLQQLLQDFAG